ncbi:hypothetical protein F2Q70_00027648 [Brassica cretica]|uniref:No apical meristem-associated C-terminal domain-containing protein n=1 Tax=Brassica cretica TaxID=69181 RepID=A0A8S9L313_BRACR|nr:hypothetical protein F2Q70_00027648 [Brassica cretica]
MDFNPFTENSNFVGLLNSQQNVPFGNFTESVSQSSPQVPVLDSHGVKAAKARGKRMMVEGKELDGFQTMWSIKKEDLAMKEKLSKMRLLENLIAKEKLAEYEEALKQKLISELLSN